MAEEQTTTATADPPQRSSGVVGAIVWSLVGLIFGAGGFAVPLLYPDVFNKAAETEEVEETSVKTAYVEFGETVVNLNSDRLNRYLRLEITFLVKETDQLEIQELVTKEQARLKSWLISYLSDVSMEDIRGAAGQNRLRREIQDHFNTVLFTDGYDRIRDVLFLEFNVQ